MSNQNNIEYQYDLEVREGKAKLKPPSMYKVVMINDDYTPMEFVIEVLEKFFSMNRERASEVMMKVHVQGKAICGTYTAEVAETKVAQVNQYARQNEHPLMCTMEQV